MPYFEVQCEIDAYTGKVFKLSQSHYGNDTGRDEIKLTDELTEKLVEKAVEITDGLGYSGYKKYMVIENPTNTSVDVMISTENDILAVGLISVNGELEFNSFNRETYEDNIEVFVKYMEEHGTDFTNS